MKHILYLCFALCFAVPAYDAFSQTQAASVSLKSNSYVADMSYDMSKVPNVNVCEVDDSLLRGGVSEDATCGVFDRMELFIVPVAEVPLLLMQTSSTHCLATWSDMGGNSAFMSLAIGRVVDKPSSRAPSIPAYAAVLLPGTTINGLSEPGVVITMQYYDQTGRPKPPISGNIYITMMPYRQDLEPYNLIGVLLKRLPNPQAFN